MWCDIQPDELEVLASDRTGWRYLCKDSIQEFENSRFQNVEEKRRLRKSRTTPSSNFSYDVYGRGRASRIGLYAHPRSVAFDGSVHHHQYFKSNKLLADIASLTVSMFSVFATQQLCFWPCDLHSWHLNLNNEWSALSSCVQEYQASMSHTDWNWPFDFDFSLSAMKVRSVWFLVGCSTITVCSLF